MEKEDAVNEILSPEDQLVTPEEISRLAERLRAIPEPDENVVIPNVVKRIAKTEFLTKCNELCYNDHGIELIRDITFILRRIGYYGDSEALKQLVDHGIIKFIFDECMKSTDTEVKTNVVTVLRDVSEDKGNFSHMVYLVKHGLLRNLTDLLETWNHNDDILGRIFYMIMAICDHVRKESESTDLFICITDLLKNNSGLLKDIVSSTRDSGVAVLAAALLYKYVGSIMGSDISNLLIPPDEQLYIPEGIAKLADILRKIPTEEKGLAQQVVSKLMEKKCIENYTQLYNKHQNVELRRDLSCVIRRLFDLGDRSSTKMMVDSGIVNHLMNECKHSNDSQIVCDTAAALDHITVYYGDNKYHVDKLIELGLLDNDMLPKLIQTWREDEDVMYRLLSILMNITYDRKDIKTQIAGNTAANNLPNILQDILATSTSNQTITSAINVIRNFVLDTNVLHKYFLTQKFFDTAFIRIQSVALDTQMKEGLIGGVIDELMTQNAEKCRDLLKPHTQSLKKLADPGNDTQIFVSATILQNKCLNSMNDEELPDLLIPSDEHLYTPEGIAKLVDILRTIPTKEEGLEQQVVSKLVEKKLLENYTELYNKHHNVEFRRDLSYLIRRVADLGDSITIRMLVDHDVVNHLMNESQHSNDSQVMGDTATALDSVVYDKGAYTHVDKLIELGVLDNGMLPNLIQTWREDENVIYYLLELLRDITYNRKDIKIQIAGNTAANNLPSILQDILATSTSNQTIMRTINVIRNFVLDTDVLHKHFLEQKFFDTVFTHILSVDLDSDMKQQFIGVIDALTKRNAETCRVMLKPHARSLKELADPGNNTEIFVSATILLNKYLNSMDDNELPNLLIPSDEQLYTPEGITKLADILRTIPSDEAELERQVVCKLVKKKLLENYIVLYNKHHNVQFRKDLCYVLDRLSDLVDRANIRILVDNDIVDHLTLSQVDPYLLLL